MDRTVIFITLAILTWVGGKQALFKAIIKRFPADYRRQTDAFYVPRFDAYSKSLGSRTALSGSVNCGKNDPSQSLQMMERPLMTPDELKSMPKGQFIVMKTGAYPMKVKLKLFFKWGITFGEPYQMPERGGRPVHYASRMGLMTAIWEKFSRPKREEITEQEPLAKSKLRPERTDTKEDEYE